MRKMVFGLAAILLLIFVASCSNSTLNTSVGSISSAVMHSESVSFQTAHPYSNNAHQDWTLEAPESAKNILVVFERFETEQNYDFVYIYDAAGNEIHKLSGTHTGAEFRVPGNVAKIVFESDYSVTEWGFEMSEFKHDADERPTDPDDTEVETVVQTILIETPHAYPNRYTNEWTVEAPEGSKNLTVFFNRFETELNYDFVYIYNAAGNEVHKLSGNHSGRSFSVDGNLARIVFISDAYVTAWGFQINQYSYNIEETEQEDDTLKQVTSCYEFRTYMAKVITNALLERPIRFYMHDGPLMMGMEKTEGGPSDHTDTNVQEEGIDEADIVETDGHYVYALNNKTLHIVKSWPAEETVEVSKVELDGYGNGMFLYEDRIAVFSSVWNDSKFRTGATRITLIDITNRQNPRIIYKAEFEGNYIDARSIDGRVNLITSMNIWSTFSQDMQDLCEEQVKCYSWYEEEDQDAARDLLFNQLLPLVKARFENLTDAELLPVLIENGTEESTLSCADIYRPWQIVKSGMLQFSSFDMNSNRPNLDTTGLIGQGYQVYSSKNNVYIAQSTRFWPWWGFRDQTRGTVIHKLSIPEQGAPDYEATGRVDGWSLDQFSMSEKDGLLRIATTEEDWGQEGRGSSVWVLRQDGRYLREVGSLKEISPGQRIFAVRFMGDIGYVVTFERVDPLHVIDFSDPENPVQLGELEIPGFSTYLHPYKEGKLLAIGRDDENNIQLSVYDVSNPAEPTRIHDHVVDTGGWSDAVNEHHAFTFHPVREVLAIPFNNYRDGERFTGSIVFKVDVEQGFTELGRIDHSDISRAAHCEDWFTDNRDKCYQNEYRWWSNMRRNVFIDEYIYSMSTAGLSVNNLYDPAVHYASLVWGFGPWTVHSNESVSIPDADRSGVNSVIKVEGKPECDDPTITLHFNIAHTYRGDLLVKLYDPKGHSQVLHSREGGSEDNLNMWDVDIDKLGKFGINGEWTLHVSDWYRQDTGTLNNWGLTLSCKGTRI